MSELKEQALSYEFQEISKWKSNDDNCINILLSSNAPVSIKRSIGYRKGFIIDKNGKCCGRRMKPAGDKKGHRAEPYKPRKTMHFDVAKVVVNKVAEVKAGWYGSYDWLTNPDWRKPPHLFSPQADDDYLKEFKKIYQKALIEHIGPASLEELQEASSNLPSVTAPDLWFINNDGNFEFIEAKLDNKITTDTQIAGLALLKKVLMAEVKIIRLHEISKMATLNDFTEKFEHFCEMIAG